MDTSHQIHSHFVKTKNIQIWSWRLKKLSTLASKISVSMQGATKLLKQCLRSSKVKSASMMALQKKLFRSPTCVATKCRGRGWMMKKQCGSRRRSWRRGRVTSLQRESRGLFDLLAASVERVRQSMKVTIQYLLTNTIINLGRSGSKMLKSCSPISSLITKICRAVSDNLKLSTCAIIYC